LSKSHPEESLGANPGDAALNPADSVAMGVSPNTLRRDRSDENSGVMRSLRHRAFRLLFVAFVINQTGFWISHLSLQSQMTQMSGNDTRMIGLLFFFLFLPAFLFAPLAGVAADRFDRKLIIVSCYGLVAACCGVLAYLTASGSITPERMLAVAAVMGLSFAFSGPASFALAANSVPAEDLSSAVSLQSAANNLTRVVGPFIAAPVVATQHYEFAFSTYLVAALVAATLTFAMRVSPYDADTDESGIWERMRTGFDHARERHPAIPALSIVAMLSFFGVSHTVLMNAYAKDVLLDERYFAWLVCATGIGAMMGAIRIGRSPKNMSVRRASRSMVAYGVALAIFAISKNVILSLITQALVGYWYFAVMTELQTLIQQIVADTMRGRVMSLFQICWAGLVPFGGLAMGYAAVPLGTPLTILCAALICIGYGAMMFARSRSRHTRVEPA
jgi:MFS family permease